MDRYYGRGSVMTQDVILRDLTNEVDEIDSRFARYEFRQAWILALVAGVFAQVLAGLILYVTTR